MKQTITIMLSLILLFSISLVSANNLLDVDDTGQFDIDTSECHYTFGERIQMMFTFGDVNKAIKSLDNAEKYIDKAIKAKENGDNEKAEKYFKRYYFHFEESGNKLEDVDRDSVSEKKKQQIITKAENSLGKAINYMLGGDMLNGVGNMFSGMNNTNQPATGGLMAGDMLE